MNKITISMIGAGSTIFMKNLLGDILLTQDIGSVHFKLQDIDTKRLEESALVLQKMLDTLNRKDCSFETTTEQKKAVEEANYIMVCFQIGGYHPSTIIDFEIPKKYGLHQTIADTLGVGGIMRALRTIPHLLTICNDIETISPNATMLNYVNPMCMNTWTMYELFPKVSQVGLCHSVQGTHELLAKEMKLSTDQVRFLSAGINHVSFFLRLEEICKDGSYRDLYPNLRAKYLSEKAPEFMDLCPNYTRFELFKYFGYFITESSEHLSEYVPWFIKEGRQDLIDKFKIPLDEYIYRCEKQIQDWKDRIQKIQQSETIELTKSHEYASTIIKSKETGQANIVYCNVKNNNLISNLPQNACVEVPCVVDANGIQATSVGNIPEHLAALMRTNINVQSLVVEAIKHKKKEHIYHAAMLDPHTAAELDLEQIHNLIDDLITAHKDILPKWLH